MSKAAVCRIEAFFRKSVSRKEKSENPLADFNRKDGGKMLCKVGRLYNSTCALAKGMNLSLLCG
jgi:hypothetical protein